MLMHVCAIRVGVLQRHEILGESSAKFCLISELVNTLPSQAKKGYPILVHFRLILGIIQDLK